MAATTTANRIQRATELAQRAGLRLQKAEEDLQIAVTLGYWGTVLEVHEDRVASARQVMDAAYRNLRAVRDAC